MNVINSWASKFNILPLGRWGTWDYANSDVCIHLALIAAAEQLGISIDDILGKL
jgi:hypothetical protein